jgi:hypothetical protein
MNLDQAIEHCLEQIPKEGGQAMVISPCDAEHLQLAMWLTQLKTIRALCIEADGRLLSTEDPETILFSFYKMIEDILNEDPSTAVHCW